MKIGRRAVNLFLHLSTWYTKRNLISSMKTLPVLLAMLCIVITLSAIPNTFAQENVPLNQSSLLIAAKDPVASSIYERKSDEETDGNAVIEVMKEDVLANTKDVTTVATKLIPKVVNAISAIIGGVAVIMLIIAGYYYLTAAGNPEAISKAHKMVMWTVVGILLVIFAYGGVFLFLNIFG
jgi:hypothetical protein